jgi:hypothetical protein
MDDVRLPTLVIMIGPWAITLGYLYWAARRASRQRRGFEVKLTANQASRSQEERENDHG